jgi:hypothetical protein
MLWSIKNKPSYTIVNYYVLMKFVYYDGPRTAINAILAIIADSGRTIVVIYTEGEEINYFLLYCIDSDKSINGSLVQLLGKRLLRVGYVPPSEPSRWREKRLHHGGDVCVLVFS